MTDGRTLQPDRASRRRLAATLVALTLTAGEASVLSQPVPAPASPAGTATRRSTTQPPPVAVAQTPRQMAEELVPILKRQKTPWQLYPSYEKIFADFADREKSLASVGNPNDSHAKRSEQLRAMAALLARMAEQAKIRDSIRRGVSDVPPDKRQSTFVSAAEEHDRLLAEFVRMAAVLPQAKASTAPIMPSCG